MKTKEKILDGAKNYLLKNGQTGFTVRAVAAEAGVNQGLVHHYFGSKENLILELIESVAKFQIQGMDERFKGKSKSEIRELMLKFFLLNFELGNLLIEFFNLAQHSETIKKKLKSIMLGRRDFITEQLGIEKDLDKIAFISGIYGILLLSRVDDSIDPKASTQHLFKMFQLNEPSSVNR